MNDNVSQMKNECPICFCDDKAFYITCGRCKKISFCGDCFNKEKQVRPTLCCCLCRYNFITNAPRTITTTTTTTTTTIRQNVQTETDIQETQIENREEAFRIFARSQHNNFITMMNQFHDHWKENGELKYKINWRGYSFSSHWWGEHYRRFFSPNYRTGDNSLEEFQLALYNDCLKKFEIKNLDTGRWCLRHNQTSRTGISIQPRWRNYNTDHIEQILENLKQRISTTFTTEFNWNQ